MRLPHSPTIVGNIHLENAGMCKADMNVNTDLTTVDGCVNARPAVPELLPQIRQLFLGTDQSEHPRNIGRLPV